jgi:ArsR family transcriptional regulator
MKHTEPSQHETAAKLFRILGNPTRLAIIEALYEREWCVCEIADGLGLNKSVTSKHLSSLQSVGIIEMRREGTRVNCVLVMPCVLEMMRCAINPRLSFAAEEEAEG